MNYLLKIFSIYLFSKTKKTIDQESKSWITNANRDPAREEPWNFKFVLVLL